MLLVAVTVRFCPSRVERSKQHSIYARSDTPARPRVFVYARMIWTGVRMRMSVECELEWQCVNYASQIGRK